MSKQRGAKPKGLAKDLPIDHIVLLPELQLRAGGLDPDHAESLAEVLRGRKRLPRVQIRLVEGKGHLATNGFHTVEAHRLAGRKTVPCNILKGTWPDAQADAIRANVEHDRAGKRRTLADKQKAVRYALANFPSWSDRAIGEHCNVAHQTVGRHRAEGGEPARVVHVPPEREPGGGECATPAAEQTKAAPWRKLPIAVAVKVEGWVDNKFRLARVETAGDLFDAIARGVTFGLPAGTVKDLTHELQQLPGFDGRFQEAAEKPAPPKSGTPMFDWRSIDGPFGQVVRLVDDAARHHPNWKDSTACQGLHRLLNEFIVLWNSAAKLNKKGAA